MSDLPIRRITIAEQADLAAWRFAETGEPEINPHEGTEDGPVWRAAFLRQLLRHTAPQAEGSA